MGLPTTRDVTQATDVPIAASLLNMLQDCIVGVKHPQLTVQVAAVDWTVNPLNAGVAFTGNIQEWAWTAAGGGELLVGLNIPLGTRIAGARYNFNRAGGTINFKISKALAGAAGWTDIVTGLDNSTAGAGVKALACAEIVAADTQYVLRVDSATLNNKLSVASFLIDRL